MSAGAPVADRDVTKLAPKFRAAVSAAIRDCNADGLDAYVYEAYRSPELAALYYTRGRPPTAEFPKPVTNARTNLYSWHGYGLAVDIISRAHRWNRPDEWWARVAVHFKRHGCKWGGDWTKRLPDGRIVPAPDNPHHQWGACKPSPSDRAREILATEGMEAVWRVVGAI